MLLSEYLGHASEETTKIYAYADTEMKRAAIDKADIVRNETPQSVPTWIDDEEMIIKLSGLIWWNRLFCYPVVFTRNPFIYMGCSLNFWITISSA